MENEGRALRDALAPFVDVRAQFPESVKLINPKLDGFTPITITVTKAQMQAGIAALASTEKADG